MTEMKRGSFGEPWVVDPYLGSRSYVRNVAGHLVASCPWKSGRLNLPAMDNAARVADCVSACTGIADPVEAVEKARTALRMIADPETTDRDWVRKEAREALDALGDGQ